MNDQSPRLGEFDYAGDDHVLPFQVEALDARGRAVQLGPMLDKIMARHDYPEPVARLLAEAITLTVLIGTSLKFDGKFMVQTQGDGPVDLLVADFTTPDAVRAYARFDEQALAQAVAANRLEPHELLGKGILAFTIDQGEFMQRYQGIVELDGATLEEIAGAYFRQSEQIPTKVRLSVAQLYDRDEDGRPRHQWRAGGVIVQFLPDAPERMRQSDLPGGDAPDDFEPTGVEDDDAWVEAVAMVESIDADELTDPLVGSERLLFRLFHERGVRVFEPAPVLDRCTCSREKIKSVLDNFTSDEIAESTDDGVIAVTCEFCSTEYRFEPEELGQHSAESESHLH
ncbi:Hsp33 family molecular chaperone [Georhizobium profundi]|uniref:Hsp33 family molecular chaperone n=1 Tax=Georhizobium profundi TaxID=2341112 RepID=A0A3Q8XM50_9HYPH|nr:Hsp33 family molecular chaperone [Georhizobium profundi]AZN70773.1 Hsp33 family molecular chaperone [Georhizobium profundi]